MKTPKKFEDRDDLTLVDIFKELFFKCKPVRTSLVALAIVMAANMGINHCYQKTAQPDQCVKHDAEYKKEESSFDYLLTGKTNFQAIWRRGEIKHAGLCDIDGDGNSDLLTLSPKSVLEIYLNNGKDKFYRDTEIPDMNDPKSVERYSDCLDKIVPRN